MSVVTPYCSLTYFCKYFVGQFQFTFLTVLSRGSPLPHYLQAQLDESYAASTLIFPNGKENNGTDGNLFFQGKNFI